MTKYMQTGVSVYELQVFSIPKVHRHLVTRMHEAEAAQWRIWAHHIQPIGSDRPGAMLRRRNAMALK